MSSSPAKGLLEFIVANIDDDTPRLAYADWLQENGQDARAEFVRVQVERARLPAWDAAQVRLRLREAKLLEEHGESPQAEGEHHEDAAGAGVDRGVLVLREEHLQHADGDGEDAGDRGGDACQTIGDDAGALRRGDGGGECGHDGPFSEADADGRSGGDDATLRTGLRSGHRPRVGDRRDRGRTGMHTLVAVRRSRPRPSIGG